MKNLLRKILIGTLLLGTSFVPVSAADIATEYNVEIKASATDESLAKEYYELGEKLRNAKKYSEAIDEFSKAIKLKPNYADAYHVRGIAYAQLGKYDDAIRDYNKAIQINPKFAMTYLNRGNTYRDLKKYGESPRDYNQAIEIDPNCSEAYSNRGWLYEDAFEELELAFEELELAFADYKKALECDPTNQTAQNNLERVRKKLQQ